MACPHVAGTAALMLGAKPDISREELKGLILGTAVRDGRVEASLDPRWGAGRLDAAAAMAEIVEVDGGCGCNHVPPERGRLSDIGMTLALSFLYLWARRRRHTVA